jgi:hypothetical protein
MLSAVYAWTLFASQAAALWPAPRSMETGNEALWLSPDIHVEYMHGNVSHIQLFLDCQV